MTKYLVTGASGFIAMHVVDQLLKQGYQVRGTIRSLNDKEKVESLKKLGPVELVEANLLDPQSLKNAVKGIDIVMHVASPVSTGSTDEDYIKPAVEGTLAVLRAALDENVKKVVLTSSTAAMMPFLLENKTYSENDWNDPNIPPTIPFASYQKSKILAERAAWDFYEENKKKGKCFELVTILPSGTLGPVLSATSGSSVGIVSRLFDKNQGDADEFVLPMCDVRDVALAHVRASQLSEANGQRFMIVSEPRASSFSELVEILKSAGYNVVNVKKTPRNDPRYDNSKMRNILKINPIEIKKSIVDMAESLLSFGLIKN